MHPPLAYGPDCGVIVTEDPSCYFPRGTRIQLVYVCGY